MPFHSNQKPLEKRRERKGKDGNRHKGDGCPYNESMPLPKP